MRNFLSLAFIVGWSASAAIAADAVANDKSLADPTRPSGFSESVVSHAAAHEKLSLTLIRLGTEPLAVINGKNVAPGESIAGYRLLSLQTTTATLAGGNGRIVLQLAPTIRKSTISSSNP